MTYFSFPTRSGGSICIPTHVVAAGFLLLLGLYICMCYQLVLDSLTASLHSKLGGWSESLQRKHNHVF